ncbi:hypothetical protein Nepgr_000413 [Nepenthes gracilis]|uniref:ABC1 atypical kinase-like domain-containing protein n=1 Tax=Nepenthes gracilis TaxID=150966 RepID=A0AAD3P2Y4_NEPGR|nr:hypothetical protein Nepgr_000413 [Nepenthes gracilis]
MGTFKFGKVRALIASNISNWPNLQVQGYSCTLLIFQILIRVLSKDEGPPMMSQLSYANRVVGNVVKVQWSGIEDAIGLDFYLIRGVGFLINEYVDITSSDIVVWLMNLQERFIKSLIIYRRGRRLGALSVASLGRLLEYGYFHVDPHPSNLLAIPEGKLALFDFGMMNETSEKARVDIIGHVVHMVNRDYEAMARDYYAMDFLSPGVNVSPTVPILRDFFDDALNSTVTGLNFKTLADGLALNADPTFKVLATSYPNIVKGLLIGRMYFRDALIEILILAAKGEIALNLIGCIRTIQTLVTRDSIPRVEVIFESPWKVYILQHEHDYSGDSSVR